MIMLLTRVVRKISPDHVAAHQRAAARRELLVPDLPGDLVQPRRPVVRTQVLHEVRLCSFLFLSGQLPGVPQGADSRHGDYQGAVEGFYRPQTPDFQRPDPNLLVFIAQVNTLLSH